MSSPHPSRWYTLRIQYIGPHAGGVMQDLTDFTSLQPERRYQIGEARPTHSTLYRPAKAIFDDAGSAAQVRVHDNTALLV